ncbi:alpha/beta fold hydrolase [Hyphomicrobiales bacterium BP6-180914]|uniref:Alpha/beta fold hydrolase n=1 Tax=Lichenifustis flavocetrariae TaxID=2949735 RepID=A0AA42CLE0_9HYPH|nr:alpha/beta fold hydrolase BchO [Lichenifustis flavocetrariae]MCW6507277.1 alpha/beta fold hydrolase [Lichenifustis flavocetrariae]
MVWENEGRDWPHRDASRFIEAGGLTWHVQVMGSGPPLLLLHGTGASTHSWRDLMSPLAARFTVIAPDLPGHAFTGRSDVTRMSLPGMAAALSSLLQRLGLSPRLAAGHSAGAAILAQMSLDRQIAPAGIISLNGALLPIGGIAGQIFSPLAKLMASSPTAARLFSWWASDESVVDRLMAQTGSRLDAKGLAFYRRLARDPHHTAGALAMMANWDLAGLQRRLPGLPVPLVLVVGSRDRSIQPSEAYRIRRLLPGAQVEQLKGLGHLAHEERPAEIVDVIKRWAVVWDVIEEPTDDVASAGFGQS